MKRATLLVLSLLVISFAGATDGKKLKVKESSSTIGWLGKKVTGEHGGLVSVKRGTVTVENGMLVEATVLADMTSISCTDDMGDEYKQKLVGHLQSPDFFNVTEHPTAEFKLTSFNKEATGQYTVKGDLTIKGITETIEFAAQVKMTDSSMTLDADVVFDRSKYDVRYGSGSFFDGLGDNLIYDDVDLKLHIEAAL